PARGVCAATSFHRRNPEMRAAPLHPRHQPSTVIGRVPNGDGAPEPDAPEHGRGPTGAYTLGCPRVGPRPHRLAAEDLALSRRRHGLESRWGYEGQSVPWSSLAVLATLSRWRSRVRIPSGPRGR